MDDNRYVTSAPRRLELVVHSRAHNKCIAIEPCSRHPLYARADDMKGEVMEVSFLCGFILSVYIR